MRPNNRREELVLILAPRGRDAEVIASVVGRDGIATEAVPDLRSLTDGIAAGAAAAVVVQEALVGENVIPLADWLASQAPWSDFPFVVLLSHRLGKEDAAIRSILSTLGNVVVLERPLSVESLDSASSSALRARRRQYLAREAFAEREAAASAVESLNQTLEARVQERTRELSHANNQITAQVMERERTQQALAHYQKMEALGRLTGGVAHDFNNLLSVIQGNVELIQLLSAEEAVRTRAATAKAACQRGSKLTGQLLSFARNQTLDLRSVGLGHLFDIVAELAKPLLGSSIQIAIGIANGAEYAVADASQLEMAMLNLVINARDAMDGNGRILLRAVRAPAPGTLAEGDYVCIEVTDDGPGIAAEVAAKIFEPFFTTKAVGKGTGLGLSQVYGMAQQSGGGAFVRSVEGQGTTIEIWLPIATAAAALTDTRLASRRALVGVKVLVVEDDDLVRAGMVDALSSFGCLVTEAASGAQALTALETGRPDLLLTDYLMPGMTGAQLASLALAQFPDLPVLVASGYADMTAIENAVGENAVLRKPFELVDLEHAISRVLEV